MVSSTLACVFRFKFFLCDRFTIAFFLLLLWSCFITTCVCEFEQPISGLVVGIAAAIVIESRTFCLK